MTYWGPLRDLPNTLTEKARELEALVLLPARVTVDDINGAAAALRTASSGMWQLMAGNGLPGCSCKHVENGNHSRLDYDEKCVHHAHLFAQLQANKINYEEAHKKLTDDLRIRLVAALLGGMVPKYGSPIKDAVTGGAVAVDLARLAIELADAAIAELAK